MKTLNIFYKEPDPDRWFKYDRYPRRIIRNAWRPKKLPGGQMIVALNLLQGLDRMNIPYRFNDFKYIERHPKELACIIGKTSLLSERKWKNPILFGASVFSHPLEYPDILVKHPNIKRILVPGEWMKTMFYPFFGNLVNVWPVGIDTDKWSPEIKGELSVDFLIYDKIRWDYARYDRDLIKPIKSYLTQRGFTYEVIRYMHYKPSDLELALSKCKACIFLCEHETQGLAYQQILATGTPILAWDRGGFWQDPLFYPERVKFSNVSSVPYWNDKLCGSKFSNMQEFESVFQLFVDKLAAGDFDPRRFITDNLTLEKCAEAYLCHVNEVEVQNLGV